MSLDIDMTVPRDVNHFGILSTIAMSLKGGGA